MKACSGCKLPKPLDSFNKHSGRKDGLQTRCKACNSQTAKQYYINNIKKHRSVVNKRTTAIRERNRKFVQKHLEQHSCTDCGIADIRVLEFDHVRGKKKNNIATLVSGGFSIVAIAEEIAKCEVRCKNCHVIKTYERDGSNWRWRAFAALSDKNHAESA